MPDLVTAYRQPEPDRLSDLPVYARITLVVWLVVQAAYVYVALAALAGVALGWKPGRYVALIAIATYFVVTYLMRGAIGQAAGLLDDLSRRERILLYAGVGCLGLVFLGVCLAPTGWSAVAVLIIVGLTGHLACHTGAAFSYYRRVMARPWPAVAAVIDDDWW